VKVQPQTFSFISGARGRFGLVYIFIGYSRNERNEKRVHRERAGAKNFIPTYSPLLNIWAISRLLLFNLSLLLIFILIHEIINRIPIKWCEVNL